MVTKAPHLYLFLGEDSFSKDIKIKKIEDEFLSRKNRGFNLDIVYAQELELKRLQELLLYMPLENKKRMLVIKEAQGLKEGLKDFLLDYAKKPSRQIVLVVDFTRRSPREEFIEKFSRYAQACFFKEQFKQDAFSLGRQIELRHAHSALKILHSLLETGEKPERILGGLRYSWEKDLAGLPQLNKRLKLLLNCDRQIKTGRLKPDLALERLILRLCCFA